MRRDNKFTLDGILVPNKIFAKLGTSALRAICKTSNLGGEHPVLIYGQQSVEALAFVVAGIVEETPLEVTVTGYLWSKNLTTNMVVDNVTFHCSSSLRSIAKNVITQVTHGKDNIKIGSKKYSLTDLVGHLYSDEGDDDIYFTQMISNPKG